MMEMIMAICSYIATPIENAVGATLQFADAHAVGVLMAMIVVGTVSGAFYEVTKIEVEKK